MGQPESAPFSTTVTEASSAGPFRPSPEPFRLGTPIASFLFPALLAIAAHSQDSRAVTEPSPAIPTLLRPRVESLLLEGDTLGALDLLQDPAERLESNEWADSLLDALVLPGDEESTPSPRTKSVWVARLDGGHIASRVSSGTTSGTILTERITRFQGDGMAHLFRGGVRWHALRGEYLTTTAIEPHISWSTQVGSLGGTLRGWALWTEELGNDAGLDLGVRKQLQPSSWMGLDGAFSLDAEQTVEMVLGTERRVGKWNFVGSVRAGWKRLIPLEADTSKIVRIDSLDGELPWRDGGILGINDVPLLSGDLLESIHPDRWILVGRCLALWSQGEFQVGPAIEIEALRSIQEERWLPGLRTSFPSGTRIMVPSNQPSRTIALLAKEPSGQLLIEGEEIQTGHHLSILSSPSVQGVWRPRGRAWSVDGLLAWNLPYTSAPGHPLEEVRRGIEARLGSEIRW